LAHDEHQAAGRLKERTYKLVLVDMRLSHTDGGERVFREIRDVNPEARVVLITGFRSEADSVVQQLLAEGADAVCYKPFDMPTMLATLKRLANR
jgi:ActR/RegA family two-component response regulator